MFISGNLISGEGSRRKSLLAQHIGDGRRFLQQYWDKQVTANHILKKRIQQIT